MAKYRLSPEDNAIVEVLFEKMGALQQQMKTLATQATYTAARLLNIEPNPAHTLEINENFVYLVVPDDDDVIGIEPEPYTPEPENEDTDGP